jgi:ribosomal protein S18 acetylase RimI-like enzyme
MPGPLRLSVAVVQMEPAHLAGVVALQALCFPPPFDPSLLWREEHLREHLRRCPECQFVAIAGGAVVGSASALVVAEEAWARHGTWEETTGGYSFAAHDAGGTTLYGADISVHPDCRGQGVARALYAARFDLVRLAGLRRFGTACRIPGYAASGMTSPEAYCEEVASGHLDDPTLTPLLRQGLRWCGVAHGHMDDPESGDAAAVLEWTP